MEFTLNSCSSQCPRASIYRLGAQMSVRKNIPGHRLDGGHGLSGRTTVRIDFLKFSWRNLSCLRTSSGRDGTSVASNFLIRLSSVRTMGDERPDGYCCANFNTYKRTNRLQYSVCASARSYPQGIALQKLISI
jgi:hypothetical protein